MTVSDRIALLAYRFWEAEGRPIGRDKLHWAFAECAIAWQDIPPDHMAHGLARDDGEKLAVVPMGQEPAAGSPGEEMPPGSAPKDVITTIHGHSIKAAQPWSDQAAAIFDSFASEGKPRSKATTEEIRALLPPYDVETHSEHAIASKYDRTLERHKKAAGRGVVIGKADPPVTLPAPEEVAPEPPESVPEPVPTPPPKVVTAQITETDPWPYRCKTCGEKLARAGDFCEAHKPAVGYRCQHPGCTAATAPGKRHWCVEHQRERNPTIVRDPAISESPGRLPARRPARPVSYHEPPSMGEDPDRDPLVLDQRRRNIEEPIANARRQRAEREARAAQQDSD